MATAGEGAAAQSASAYEGGGVGGKFRKRPFRGTQTTPYDRPPTALRNPSWLSKLVVDPASKLLAAGAQRFFSSVFRKRLPPPPHPPRQLSEEKQESRNMHQETVPDNCAGTQEPADVVGGSSTCKNDTGGISELEQLLKQKTFTRSEIDRLSELLHSRAVDLPVKEDGKRSEANLSIQNNFSKPMSDTGMHQEFPVHLEGNKIEKVRAHGAVSTPTASKKLLEDEIASPAELAKAYIGSNPLKVSPSTLGLPSQIAREDAGLLINSPFISKPPMKSLAVKTTGHVGIPRNGFTTPISRGRTAIYNMARTPYSRLHLTPVQKVSGSENYGYSRPSSSASQSVWDNGVQNGSKPVMQALKRRSSVLDDDIGSVGPIRRIRQKPNLLSHGISLPSRGMSLGSDATHFHKLPLMDETKNRASNTPSTSYAHVPPESSEMAARIFEHLEKMTPKEKSSESKLATARERSSFKLTPNMLRGQALRSLEDLDASKLLQNSQNDHKLGDQPISSLPDSRDFTTQERGRVEENGPATFVHPVDKLAPVVNTDNTVTPRDINLSTEDAVAPNFIPQSSERKRGFKMSAHEDSLELDDDVPLNEPASESDKGRGMEKMDSKSIPSEGKKLDKMPVPSEVRIDPVPVLSKITELDASSAPMAGEEHTGFTFSLLHASAKRSQSAFLSQSALAPAKPTTSGDSPLFVSFGSKTRESVHSTDSKAESSSSLMNVFGATDAKVPESDKSNTKSSQLLDGIVNGQSGVVPSLASNSMSMISIFSAGAPFSNLVSSNGPLASSASMLSSSSAPVSSKLSNQNFTNSSSNMVSLVGTTTISTNGSTTSTSAASDSGLFVATMAPSISSAPVFNFRSSKDPLTASSAASTTANAETTDLKVDAEKDNSFGKGNSSFGSTSFAAASTGSSIFGLDSFVSSAAANSQLQGSVTASGSVVSTQPPSTGSGIATVSQSVPVQFGSSSSLMVFGPSGVASFTSSSIFGSSAPATSAQSFSASTSETNLVNSSSGGAPSIVKFGVGSSASEVNAISSSSTATSGTFTFGVSSAASSSPSSSVTPGFFSFGASSLASSSVTTSSSIVPGMFSFGAGSTVSSSVTSSSTTPGIFSFGASSSGSSSSANAVTSSSGTAPSVFSFGASNPASSSAANSVSSGGASSSSFGSTWQASGSPIFGSTLNTISSSTGFSFGASSSSFGATNSSPMVFGSATGTSSNPVFSFSAAPGTTFSLPSSTIPTVFGNSTSPFGASPGNNDQMNTEDSMAEDPVQSSTSAAPVFGQSPVSPSPQGFMFGPTVPSPAAVPFQFGGQQNKAVPQNPSPFQQSSSLEFNPGGSFSLGSGGGDKSGRKIVKVNRNRNKKR